MRRQLWLMPCWIDSFLVVTSQITIVRNDRHLIYKALAGAGARTSSAEQVLAVVKQLG